MRVVYNHTFRQDVLTTAHIPAGCFNDSYRQLYDALSDDELPDIPSTPDLDRQLAELLEMSFDNLIL